MFGGFSNGHPGFPALVEENHSQYDMHALPQLQLFGEFPVGCTLDNINIIGNERTVGPSRPIKRAREPEPMARPQKLKVSTNTKFCQDDGGLTGSTMNTNPVSTGLRLSYEEEERNSCVTSTRENIKAFEPVGYSLMNSVKIELAREKELFDRYVKVQGENFVKGMSELNRRHTASLLNTLEKEVSKKLREKDIEIDTLNQKNMELDLKIKQVAMEAQSWHYRAKYNESIVNALKSNLQQVIAQGQAQGKEGFGESEVDEAASSTNQIALKNSIMCRNCKVKEVCVLLMPCRHLCLCIDCESGLLKCPVCDVTKTASLCVSMS